MISSMTHQCNWTLLKRGFQVVVSVLLILIFFSQPVLGPWGNLLQVSAQTSYGTLWQVVTIAGKTYSVYLDTAGGQTITGPLDADIHGSILNNIYVVDNTTQQLVVDANVQNHAAILAQNQAIVASSNNDWLDKYSHINHVTYYPGVTDYEGNTVTLALPSSVSDLYAQELITGRFGANLRNFDRRAQYYYDIVKALVFPVLENEDVAELEQQFERDLGGVLADAKAYALSVGDVVGTAKYAKDVLFYLKDHHEMVLVVAGKSTGFISGFDAFLGGFFFAIDAIQASEEVDQITIDNALMIAYMQAMGEERLDALHNFTQITSEELDPAFVEAVNTFKTEIDQITEVTWQEAWGVWLSNNAVSATFTVLGLVATIAAIAAYGTPLAPAVLLVTVVYEGIQLVCNAWLWLDSRDDMVGRAGVAKMIETHLVNELRSRYLTANPPAQQLEQWLLLSNMRLFADCLFYDILLQRSDLYDAFVWTIWGWQNAEVVEYLTQEKNLRWNMFVYTLPRIFWAYDDASWIMLNIASNPKHDYGASNIQSLPASPSVNINVVITATITNYGTSNEANVPVTLYVDDVARTNNWISLNSNAATTTTFNWTATEGVHNLRVQTNLTDDSIPGNNSIAKTIAVGTAPLVKVNGSTNPGAYLISATTAGTSGTFSVPVQNVGSAPTTVSVSKGGTRSSWLSITTTSFSLDANRTINYTFNVTVPANQSIGTHTAEIYFDWSGTRTTLPIQFVISQFSEGSYPHTFSPSSATIDGRIDFIYQPHQQLYQYLDNYSTTTFPTYVDGYFSFTGDTFARALEGCNWEVRGIENQASGTSGLYLSMNNSAVATRTDSFATTCFPIFSKLINGQNYWKISLTNYVANANNVQWEVERNTIFFNIVRGAWASSSLAPGTSMVEVWRDGWDYGRVCGTVGSVTTAGDTDLYNNGFVVATKSISTSDEGDEVCWSLSSSEVSGTNYFNLKPDGGTIFTISNLHFDLHYFTGQPSIQATRIISPQPAQVGQNITVTVSLHNNGSNIADNPEYTDTLPSGLQLVSGSLSGRITDVRPAQTQTAVYTVRATSAGVFTIPSSVVAYEDPANNDYQTTMPSVAIEVWGGTLQPTAGAISTGEVGSPLSISATVVDTLSGSAVSDAAVIANITRPTSGVDSVALLWNSTASRYEGNYYPAVAGQHQVSISASKPYYTTGVSPNQPFTVLARNENPTAVIANSSYKTEVSSPLVLDGQASIDPDGSITRYDWDIDNNGSIDATGPVIQWAYASSGSYTVKLIVTDNRNATGVDSAFVEIVVPLAQPLQLSGAAESDTAIRLNWLDQSPDETRFEIERSINETTGWNVVSQVSSGVTTFLDNPLTCNQIYYYRVRAYRSEDAWYSPYTDVIAVQTEACPVMAPEIEVRGNSVVIANGDISPSVADDTDFGSVNVPAGSVSHNFAIHNTGTGNLTLDGIPSVVISGDHSDDFIISTFPSGTVLPAGSSVFTVRFDPSDAGTRSATITIANNDNDEDPYVFSIQGTGTVPAYLLSVQKSGTGSGTVTSSPAGINCGSTCSNSFSSNTQVALTASPASGSIFSGWSGAGCSGLGTCSILMTSPQSVEAIFTLVSSPSPEIDLRYGANNVAIVNGDATPSTADGTDFGIADIASGTVSHWFSVWNLGTASLQLTGNPRVVISGPSASEFTVTSQPSSPIGAGGNSVQFEVVFNPGDIGTRSATISIANNDDNENPYYFIIQGTGTGTELAPPTNVTATKGEYANQVCITWDEDGGIGHEISRATSLQGMKSVLNPDDLPSYSYCDTSVTPGSIYYYWVQACSGHSACGPYSNPDYGYAGSARFRFYLPVLWK